MNCIKNERIKNEIIKNERIKNERIKNELIKKELIHLSYPASLLSDITPILPPSCSFYPSHPSSLLTLIPPVWHPSCPAFLLSSIPLVRYPSCPASNFEFGVGKGDSCTISIATTHLEPQTKLNKILNSFFYKIIMVDNFGLPLYSNCQSPIK